MLTCENAAASPSWVGAGSATSRKTPKTVKVPEGELEGFGEAYVLELKAAALATRRSFRFVERSAQASNRRI